MGETESIPYELGLEEELSILPVERGSRHF